MKDKSFMSLLLPKTLQQKENEPIKKEDLNREKYKAKLICMYKKQELTVKPGKVISMFR